MTPPHTAAPPEAGTPAPFVERAPRSEPALVGDTPHQPPRRLSGTRRPGPHVGRSPSRTRSTPADQEQRLRIAEAHAVADRTLRAILEVIDRRRPATRLGAAVSPAVTGMIGALATAAVPGRNLGSATLGRVHLRPSAPDAAEIFGTYSRGRRVFAFAGRLERTANARWTIVSLRLS